MNDLSDISLGKSKTVRGVEIKRMPLGRYIKAMNCLKSAPGEFLEECFPGAAGLEDVLGRLMNLDRAALENFAAALFAVAPKYLARMVSEFSGISEEELLESEDIGLDGIFEIIGAIIEVNNLGKLGGALKKTLSGLRLAAAEAAGSSAL